MLQTDIYLHPAMLLQLKKIASRVYSKIGEFKMSYFPSTEPISCCEVKKLDFIPINKGQSWAKESFDCAWFKFEGAKPANAKNVVALINLSGEGMVYDENFCSVAAVTSVSNKINLFQINRGKQEVKLDHFGSDFTLYIDAGFNGVGQAGYGKAKINRCDICIKDDIYYDFYYSFMTLFSSSIAIDDKERCLEIKNALKEAFSNLENPQKAVEILKEELHKKTYEELRYIAVGHGHLDLAWLWPIRETRRKVYRTLISQINNLEICRDFVYGISQPQQLAWLKEDNLELFLKVKELLINGNFEPQGGMWTECDCNLIGGESFIRQFYHGLKFWEEEIGVKVKTCWLPDVFGFSGSLPKIIRGCGIENFMTIKMSWNTVNTFPHSSFNWIGNDGSKVRAHIPPEGDYTCTASPFILKRGIDRHKESHIAPVALIAYGVGDGGCGPSEAHIEMIKRERNLNGLPSVKFGSADEFFRELENYQEALPDYEGELYLEKHQGTFTSQAKNKYYNRHIEYLLHCAEFYQSQLFAKGISVEDFNLDKIWEEVLLYQFHDIIPGSSIHRVYAECIPRYQILEKELKTTIRKMASSLQSKSGYFNCSPAYKEEIVKVENDFYFAKAQPYSNAILSKIENKTLKYDDYSIENANILASFNKNGEIISIYDKINNRETLSSPSNVLNVYRDPKLFYNAWDIDPIYEKLPKSKFKLVNVEYEVTDGEIQRIHTYRYHTSKLVQTIILSENSKFLDFETIVEWNETLKMLRADFFPIDFGEEVICDTQFAYKKYRTTENDSIEKAQFEINAHKFVETSKDNYSFALLNNCKYGHRIKNGKLSLNLLRSTVFPDETADKGKHAFNYAVYPHKGGLIEGKTQDLAYAYNYDFVPFELPDPTSFVTIENPNIVLETIKPAFNNSGIILRLYEKSGTAQSTEIINPNNYSLFETNMLENNPVAVGNILAFDKFDVKTILVKIN